MKTKLDMLESLSNEVQTQIIRQNSLHYKHSWLWRVLKNHNAELPLTE